MAQFPAFGQQLLDQPWRVDRTRGMTYIQAEHTRDSGTWCDLCEMDEYLNAEIADRIVAEHNLLLEQVKA